MNKFTAKLLDFCQIPFVNLASLKVSLRFARYDTALKASNFFDALGLY